MDQDLSAMPQDLSREQDDAPDAVPVPHLLVPHLNATAVLLDIDGTLLDLAEPPRDAGGAQRRAGRN